MQYNFSQTNNSALHRFWIFLNWLIHVRQRTVQLVDYLCCVYVLHMHSPNLRLHIAINIIMLACMIFRDKSDLLWLQLLSVTHMKCTCSWSCVLIWLMEATKSKHQIAYNLSLYTGIVQTSMHITGYTLYKLSYHYTYNYVYSQERIDLASNTK